MSHLRVVGRDEPAKVGSLFVPHVTRCRRLGDLGNLLAEYARLRNSPGRNWSRRSCLITAWHWRRIWRGGKPPVWQPGPAERAAFDREHTDDALGVVRPWPHDFNDDDGAA